MANVKSRVKSQKSSKKTYVRKGKKTSPEPKPKVTESDTIVKRRESTTTPMTASEQVAMLLKHGHLVRDQFKLRKPKKIDKSSLKITKATMVADDGIIRSKTRDKLHLLDNILKQELMICDRSKSKSKHSHSKKTNHNNNICTSPEKNNNEKAASGIGSPEALDDNSNKITKEKPKKSKHRSSDRHGKSRVNNEAEKTKPSKRKQVTLSNGVVLTMSLFFCDYCDKGFSNKSSLRRHIFIHLNIKPYSCKYCSKRFRQRSNLKAHTVKKHYKFSKKPYVCTYCSKPFQSEDNFNLHVSNHIKKETSFQCVFCEKKFGQQLALMDHEKQHLVSGRFSCSICKMSYDCRSRLAVHVKSHLNIKEYVCPYCGKEFLRPNSIRRHIEICHDGFRIQCPICNKQLKGHLTEHMRMHEKKRPHRCPECGQCFTQSTQLSVHRRGHTGARPYPCRICQQKFTHSNALMLHIRRHTGEKPFPCAMCPTFFSQLPHMKAHMKKIHGKNDPYKCPKCDEFFKLKVHIEAHAKTCTVGDKELSFEESIQAAAAAGAGGAGGDVESGMSLSRMRFLIALLLTMIATKDKLKYLGFNKRLIDDLLTESIEAMGKVPVRDETLSPLMRLKTNIRTLLEGTVPPDQMKQFKRENKSTEELLELLTGEKK